MSQTRSWPTGHAEPHRSGMATRLNWLRAAVLGANDGIVSTAGLVVGVAGATSSRTAILTAGPQQLAHPGHAAAASFMSFAVGAVLPLLAIMLVPGAARIPVTILAVLAALAATGAVSAALGRAPRGPAVVRNVIGGAIAMGVSYGIGSMIGAATTVMRAVSAAGGPLVLAAVAAVAGGLLALLRRSLRPVLLAGVTLAGTGGLTIMLKEALDRPRPPLDEALAAADGHAFPSAHAATAAAVFGTLAYPYAARLRSWSARVAVWAAAAMLTALVGISRVYLGVHWTTDVIGGWAFGVLWLAVVVTGWTIVTRHRQPGIPGRSGRGDRDPGPSLPGEGAMESATRIPDLSDGRRAGRRDGSTA